MKKIFLSIFAVFLSVASILGGGLLFSGTSRAGTENISTSATFSGGSGTESDPYLVSTVSDLLDVVMVNHSGKYFKQTNDINASAMIKFLYYRKNVVFQNSTYDGQNYSIIGLTVRLYSYAVGLFAHCVQSTLKNIVLEDVDINILVYSYVGYNPIITSEASLSIGGLCATALKCTISQCAVMGSIADNGQDGSGGFKAMGSLVGLSQQNTIDQCFAKTSISSEYALKGDVNTYCGGLIGGNYFSGAALEGNDVITNCYFSGAALEGNDVITNCYFLGSIISTYNYVGGLMGFNFNSRVGKCYAMKPNNSNRHWMLGYNSGGLFGRLFNTLSSSLCADLFVYHYDGPMRSIYGTPSTNPTSISNLSLTDFANWCVGEVFYGSEYTKLSGRFIYEVGYDANIISGLTKTDNAVSTRVGVLPVGMWYNYLRFDSSIWYWDGCRQFYYYNLYNPSTDYNVTYIVDVPMLAWYENLHKNTYLFGTSSTPLICIEDYTVGGVLYLPDYLDEAPQRTGYELNGWHTSSTLTENPLNPVIEAIIPATTSLGHTDLVLYASWAPIAVKVNIKFMVSTDITASNWEEVDSLEGIAESFGVVYYSTELSGTGTKQVDYQGSVAQTIVMRDMQGIRIGVTNLDSDYSCLGFFKEGGQPNLKTEKLSEYLEIDGNETIYIYFKLGSVLKYDEKNKYFYYEYKSHPQTAVMTYDVDFDKHLTSYKDTVEYTEFESGGQDFIILNYSYSSDTLADKKDAYLSYDGEKFLGVYLNDSWCWLRFDPVIYRVSNVGTVNDSSATLYENPVLDIKILFSLPIGFEDSIQ